MTEPVFLTPFLEPLETLVDAVVTEEVALVACVDRRTGKDIAVLCKVVEDLGSIEPIAILCSKEDLASIIIPEDDSN